MKKSIESINKKIKKGKAVVLTAKEYKEKAKGRTNADLLKSIDIVTTATYGPMCSTGVFVNFGHTNPPINIKKAYINKTEIFCGIAAVDAYIGATQASEASASYGGAHIIEALVKGEDVLLEAYGKSTDCYPEKSVSSYINKNSVNEIYFFNPRNVYQNYPAAINLSDKTIYTYFGKLKPKGGNIRFSTAGDISPLLNDPDLETLGIGSSVYFAGAKGYISWAGTQFNTCRKKNENGIPIGNARALALIADLKNVLPKYIKAIYLKNYGISIYLGIGIPIPVISESIAQKLRIENDIIHTAITDYSDISRPEILRADYKSLFSGEIDIKGKKVKAYPLTNYKKSLMICEELKDEIKKGHFYLTEFIKELPEYSKMNNLIIKK